MDRLDR